MRQTGLSRFFGGSPARVLLQLIFLSFVVGVVLSAIDLHPLDLVYWIREVLVNIWNLGFDALGRVGIYFVTGAIIVFPIWLLSRLLKMGRGEE